MKSARIRKNLIARRLARRGVAVAAGLGIGALVGSGDLEVRAAERIKVVATLPDLASIAHFVGGDRVEVECLSKGYEDPHFVVPTPSLMVLVNKADLFVELGLQLEQWADNVLQGARNPRVLAGQPGHVIAGEGIETIEKAAILSRSGGDVHPQGNPHVWLSPLLVKQLAANVAAGLKRVDPSGASDYEGNLKSFQDRIDRSMFGDELPKIIKPEQLERLLRVGKLYDYLDSKEYEGRKLSTRLGGWLARMQPVRGMKLVAHHKTWGYFERDFGIDIVGWIEPKPGLAVTPAHLAELKETIRSQGVKLIIHDPFYPPQYAQELAAETGIREVTVPSLVGGVPGADDTFKLFDVLTERIVGGLRP